MMMPRALLLLCVFYSTDLCAVLTRSMPQPQSQRVARRVRFLDTKTQRIVAVLKEFAYMINHSERFKLEAADCLKETLTKEDLLVEKIRFVLQTFLDNTRITCAVENKQSNAYKLRCLVEQCKQYLDDSAAHEAFATMLHDAVESQNYEQHDYDDAGFDAGETGIYDVAADAGNVIAVPLGSRLAVRMRQLWQRILEQATVRGKERIVSERAEQGSRVAAKTSSIFRNLHDGRAAHR